MMLASELKDSPLNLAEEIKESLAKEIKESEEIGRVEAVAPGYINFYLSKKYFNEIISEVLRKDEKWGETSMLSGKKYIFEHSSPNLFKPFHIGHLVNNSIGESLSRIIKINGASVKNLSFPSDVSPGIAKTVWAVKKKNWEDEMTLERIGEAYVFGSKAYKESEEAKKEIDEINKNIYLGESFEEKNIYKKGYDLSLKYFNEITTRLGSEFDGLIFESEAEKEGKRIVKENVPKIFEESQGAIIFPGARHGLFDNVFINSQGFGTYLAKDIGLLNIKFNKFDFDKSITITDIEQKENFLLVKKSAGLINKEWEDKSEFIQHGRLSFAEGKISSRYGNVPLAEDLIKKTKEKVFDKIADRDFSGKKREDMAEKIAIGALKYSIVSSSAGRNMVFDFDKSIAFEGNSGPYLQYSFVRTNSVLGKIENFDKSKFAKPKERNGEVPNVEKLIAKFPMIMEKSLEEYSPHVIANYLQELASEFNSFYAQTKIADENNKDYKNNVALTEAVRITLKNGLYLLGIETVDKM
jgi:arginyl-tRNA synthetase